MVGTRIKNLRIENGYSISELAKRAGVSKSYLSQIERGLQINPSLQLLSKVADPLNTTIEYLLGNEENIPCKERLDSEWTNLVKEAINDGMSKQEFKELSNFIRFKNQQNSLSK